MGTSEPIPDRSISLGQKQKSTKHASQSMVMKVIWGLIKTFGKHGNPIGETNKDTAFTTWKALLMVIWAGILMNVGQRLTVNLPWKNEICLHHLSNHGKPLFVPNLQGNHHSRVS